MFKVDFGGFVAAWPPNGYDFRKVRQILHILGGPGFFWRPKTGVSRPVEKTTICRRIGKSKAFPWAELVSELSCKKKVLSYKKDAIRSCVGQNQNE